MHVYFIKLQIMQEREMNTASRRYVKKRNSTKVSLKAIDS